MDLVWAHYQTVFLVTGVDSGSETIPQHWLIFRHSNGSSLMTECFFCVYVSVFVCVCFKFMLIK